jgi:hypothetical protein
MNPVERFQSNTWKNPDNVSKSQNRRVNKRISHASLSAANEIANLFSEGFFDDRMIKHVATIIKQEMKKVANDNK